jgi:hypothetical protein
VIKFAISPGNSKLGQGIWTFSIPSGLSHICVGATPACLRYCYAQRGHFLHSNTQRKYQENYKLSLSPKFTRRISSEISAVNAKVFRIHPSGEFYSTEYINKWLHIALRHPAVTFFAYTRSWAAKDLGILSSLVGLTQARNLKLWFSCDADTGPPPRVKGVRRAYMLSPGELEPAYAVDLIFRVKRKTVQKRVQGALVCPHENGVTKTSCSTCKLCYSNRLVQLK